MTVLRQIYNIPTFNYWAKITVLYTHYIYYILKYQKYSKLFEGVKSCEDLYLKRAEIKLLFSAISFQHYMQISQVKQQLYSPPSWTKQLSQVDQTAVLPGR